MFAFTQDVPIDRETYARIVAAIGEEPIPGQLVHICVELESGGLRYIDVWESKEAFTKAMDERIHPAVDAAFGGSRPGTEPTSTRLNVIDVRGNVAVAPA